MQSAVCPPPAVVKKQAYEAADRIGVQIYEMKAAECTGGTEGF